MTSHSGQRRARPVSGLLVVLALASGSGCAAARYPDIDDPLPSAAAPPAAGAAASTGSSKSVGSGAGVSQVADAGTLRRADVERVVDAGLGRFLTHLELEPNLVSGRFRGWRIVSLNPAELWQGIDLKPGDVVTRINGMPIERELEAYEAFQAVRQAPELNISVERRGQARQIRYKIVGPPSLPPRPANPAKSG